MAEAYGRAPYGGDRDEDDAAMAKEWQAQKDATVFLVDCGPAMARIVPLRADEDASQAAAPLRGVDLAFHLIETSLRNTIVSNDTDLFAVVLFNTRESSNALHFEHVVTLETPRTQAIDVTTSRRIQQLRRLPATFDTEVGFGSDQVEGALAHGLWVSSDLIQSALKGKASSGATKRVVLFTNDTSPLSAGSDGCTAVERARLLQQMGIYVHVVALSAPTHPGWAFYKRIHNDPDTPWDDRFEERLDALQERVRQRTHKKRRLTSLELYVCPGGAVGLPGSLDGSPVRMAVGLYSLVMQATKPTPERVDKQANVPVKSVSKFMARGYNSITFNPRDHAVRQVRRLPYGGAALDFTPHEAADLKAGPGQPGLALLGFKPISSLRDDDQLRSSWFLHPEEALRPGSTVAFTALLAAMLRAGVVAICLLTRSAKTPPRLVALLPQGPEVETRRQSGAGGGEVAVMTAQPGMHVLCLPFRDDVRVGIEDAVLPCLVAPPPPSEEVARAAAAVVSGIKLTDFACEGVPNPKLQHFYTKLEEFAIDADDVVMDSIAPEAPHEATTDGTLPQVGSFHHAALEAFSASLRGRLDPVAPVVAAAKGGTKRKAAEMDAETQQKADDATAVVVRLGEDGKVALATVDQLKWYCRIHGLAVGGKKGDLVARVEKHMEGGV